MLAALAITAMLAGSPPAPSSDNSLRVMAGNVLHGSNDVEQGPEKTLAVIHASDPDVILMQESYDIDGERPKLGKWLSEQLGWNYHQGESPHLCVLTPLEMDATFFHHPWHGVGARLTDARGRSFLAWSIWLDYRAYITYELRDNPDMSDAELLAAEDVRSNRLPQAKALIAHLQEAGQLDVDIPVIVGGDWNTPSHLDWTADTVRVFKRRRDLDLPVSIAMRDAGFSDAFRDVHPDPVQQPGITWSPMFRGTSEVPQGFERIDRIYLKNAARPTGDWTLHPVAGTVLPYLAGNALAAGVAVVVVAAYSTGCARGGLLGTVGADVAQVTRCGGVLVEVGLAGGTVGARDGPRGRVRAFGAVSAGGTGVAVVVELSGLAFRTAAAGSRDGVSACWAGGVGAVARGRWVLVVVVVALCAWRARNGACRRIRSDPASNTLCTAGPGLRLAKVIVVQALRTLRTFGGVARSVVSGRAHGAWFRWASR